MINQIVTDRIKLSKPPHKFIVNTESMVYKKRPIETQYNIYTDGSKTENHVGAGFTIMHNKQEITSSSIKLSPNATVFQAEILAIKEAAVALTDMIEHNNGEQIMYVKILTDSQAALQALNTATITSKLVLDTIEKLNIAAQKTQ